MRQGGGNQQGQGNRGGGGGGGGRRRGRNRNRHGDQGGGGGGQGEGGGGGGGGGGNQRHQGGQHNKNRNQRHGQNQQSGGNQQSRPQQPKQQKEKVQLPPVKPLQLAPKRFGIAFFDTFAAAKADAENLKAQAANVDQLNIVVLEEGNMDDPVLSPIGKVFAGAAWTLIHQRRMVENWYEKMQPAGPVLPAMGHTTQRAPN